jgi:hypothetical protein
VGRCVYRGGDAAPTGVLRSTLFALNGVRAFTGDRGDGNISQLNAGGPTYPFGTFASRLSPISILMEPSVPYTVWLWCWHAAAGTQGAPFLSFVSCDVPIVTIETSEPCFRRFIDNRARAAIACDRKQCCARHAMRKTRTRSR